MLKAANNSNNKNGNNYNAASEDRAHSTHRCCAERRLLDTWISKARRHGLQQHQVVTWIRRKAGADITVWRQLANGTLGCATPCVFCSKELQRFDLKVHCVVQRDGCAEMSWFSGRLNEDGAPCSKMTSGQKMQLQGGQDKPVPVFKSKEAAGVAGG